MFSDDGDLIYESFIHITFSHICRLPSSLSHIIWCFLCCHRQATKWNAPLPWIKLHISPGLTIFGHIWNNVNTQHINTQWMRICNWNVLYKTNCSFTYKVSALVWLFYSTKSKWMLQAVFIVHVIHAQAQVNIFVALSHDTLLGSIKEKTALCSNSQNLK